MAFWNRFFGSAGSTAAGVAIGATAVPALTPGIQEIINNAWDTYANMPPDPYALANGVAQGQVSDRDGRAWARQSGIGDAQFDALINIANTGPGAANAIAWWRRGIIAVDGLIRALKREAWEDEWINDLIATKDVLLTPAEIAVMVQRTILANDGLLPGQPSTAGSNVPPMPETGIDPVEEAAMSGVTRERLAAMTRIIGLPASLDLAARMHFRKIITEGAYNQAVLEGNTRGEWAPFLLDGFREITSAHDGIEGRLRGWLTDAEMYAQTARHGMSKEDTDLLFKVTGRPLSFHQVFIGLRRHGVYDGPVDAIDPAFLKSLRESNIRPEWYNLAWAQRHTYPSAFVLRALTQAGDLTQAETEQILLYEGWEPSLAAKVSAKWGGGGGTAGKELLKAELLDEFEGGFVTESELRDHLTALGYSGHALDLEVHLTDARRIKGWRDKGITALGKRYVASTMDASAADGYLVELGVTDPVTRGRIIRVWDIEREFK